MTDDIERCSSGPSFSRRKGGFVMRGVHSWGWRQILLPDDGGQLRAPMQKRSTDQPRAKGEAEPFGLRRGGRLSPRRCSKRRPRSGLRICTHAFAKRLRMSLMRFARGSACLRRADRTRSSTHRRRESQCTRPCSSRSGASSQRSGERQSPDNNNSRMKKNSFGNRS